MRKLPNIHPGEVLLEAGKKVTHEAIKRMLDKKVSKIKLLTGDPEKDDPTILETLRKDKIKSVKEAQQDIYKKLRGQEFIVPGQAEAYLDNLIFKNLRKYDLSKVGRHKIAAKLHSSGHPRACPELVEGGAVPTPQCQLDKTPIM